MRIGILTHGNNLFGRHYVRAFRERGHEAIELLLTQRDLAVPFGEINPSEVYQLGPKEYQPLRTSSRLPYLKMTRPVRRAVKECNLDIVFGLYLSSAGVLACLSGHPHVVVSARGGDVNDHIQSCLWRTAFRWMGRRADMVHTVSQPLADLLHSKACVPEEKFHVSCIGVDTSRFGIIDPNQRPGRGRILSTRVHKPVYDQGTLVRAVAELKRRGIPCDLTFATSAHEVEKTRSVVKECDVEDCVTFLPSYDIRELPDLMRQADVYVSCSLSDGTSSSLLEALSMGTFPVVSDIESNRVWINSGENGLLFPTGNWMALADALVRSMNDKEWQARAAVENRCRVKEHGDMNKNMDALLDAFEICLRSR
jgi:L-malate glycosyltransferase